MLRRSPVYAAPSCQRQPGQESDARRRETGMFDRRAERLWVHHARPPLRSINALRN
jgi:hypothetical protein